MKPILLVMSAFGPYLNETTIDFRKLGSKGLYLITGETGAGKTTIFDAVTYALYGKPSGNVRNEKMLRSKFATPNQKTYVELTFEYKGQEYCIRRNPEYERNSLRGDGTTLEKPSAELRYPDGRIVNKTEEVNTAIEEILGLNRSQFSQIVMIAQGDFQTLLTADTNKRKAILERLFNTAAFTLIQKKINEDANALFGEIKDLRKSINQYIKDIADDDVKYADYINDDNSLAVPLCDIMQKLSDSIEHDEQKKIALTDELKQCEKSLETISAEIEKAETQQSNEEKLGEREKTLKAEQEKRDRANKELNKANKNKKATEDISRKIGKIESELADYTERDNISNSFSDAKKKLESATEKLKELKGKEKEISDFLKSCKSELAELDGIEDKLAQIEVALINTKNRIKDLNELAKCVNKIKKENTALADAQEEYKDKQAAAADAKNDYNEKNRAFLDGQAGILAEALDDGCPCPVCGSVCHPSKAHRPESVPTEAELNEYKNAVDKASGEEKTASEKAHIILETIKNLEEQFKENSEKLMEFVPDKENAETVIADEIQKTEKAEKDFEAKLSDTKEKAKRKKELSQKKEFREKELADIITAKSTCESEKTESETTIKNLTGRLNTLNGKLTYKSREEAEKAQAELKEEAEKIQQSIDSAQEIFDEIDKKVSEYEGAIKTLKEALKDKIELDLVKAKQQQADLQEQKNNISDENGTRTKVITRLSSNQNILKKITDFQKKLEKKEAEFTWLNELNKTAAGQMNGKEKFQFDTWVQMYFFDRIIDRANIRFSDMTDGRYELARQETAENNRSQTGLDLDVIDNRNGTRRSVKTLSGGESFKASLSLALGLSDEIQNNMGGVQLDTLFVDEGFGSLDDESLEQAMRVLVSLADGNRLVGIISHVTALKERIDKKIVVTKNYTGESKIEIKA